MGQNLSRVDDTLENKVLPSEIILRYTYTTTKTIEVMEKYPLTTSRLFACGMHFFVAYGLHFLSLVLMLISNRPRRAKTNIVRHQLHSSKIAGAPAKQQSKQRA